MILFGFIIFLFICFLAVLPAFMLSWRAFAISTAAFLAAEIALFISAQAELNAPELNTPEFDNPALFFVAVIPLIPIELFVIATSIRMLTYIGYRLIRVTFKYRARRNTISSARVRSRKES